jgi:hypothetical protein
MFSISQNGPFSGFSLTLENGYTVSVQFGRERDERGTGYQPSPIMCRNAEIAVLDPNGEFVALQDHDDVIGYQTVSQLIAIINKFDSKGG